MYILIGMLILGLSTPTLAIFWCDGLLGQARYSVGEGGSGGSSKEEVWTHERVQRLLASSQADVDAGKIPDSLKQYKTLTGIDVELAFGKDVCQFLSSKGLDPDKLEFVGEGDNGKLFTHPDWPNRMIKIDRLAFDAHNLPKKKLGNFDKPVATYSPEGDTEKASYKAEIERAKKSRKGLREAIALIELGVLIEQTQIPYFDFIRIHAVGNHFYVREYYPDATLESGVEAAKIMAEDGKDPRTELETAEAALKKHEGLFNIVGFLTRSIPSFFSSKALYKESKEKRPRLFIIYDLD